VTAEGSRRSHWVGTAW